MKIYAAMMCDYEGCSIAKAFTHESAAEKYKEAVEEAHTRRPRYPIMKSHLDIDSDAWMEYWDKELEKFDIEIQEWKKTAPDGIREDLTQCQIVPIELE